MWFWFDWWPVLSGTAIQDLTENITQAFSCDEHVTFAFTGSCTFFKVNLQLNFFFCVALHNVPKHPCKICTQICEWQRLSHVNFKQSPEIKTTAKSTIADSSYIYYHAVLFLLPEWFPQHPGPAILFRVKCAHVYTVLCAHKHRAP